VTKNSSEWQIYRSRFLIRAKKLNGPLVFVDALGREQRGKKGDYLVESFSGLRRIWPRRLFENSHALMSATDFGSSALAWISAMQGTEARPAKTVPGCGKSRSGAVSQPLIA
jgi:hypothetical protein